MTLRFLGQTYSTFNNKIETIPSEETARFLGQTYITRRSFTVVNSRSEIRKYRGVVYGN